MARFATPDLVVGGLGLLAGLGYVISRRLTMLAVWMLLVTVIAAYGFRLPVTVSVLISFATVFVVAQMGRTFILERFENESASEDAVESKKKEPVPHSDDPHLDAGTTILHAYRKLDPEQVVQMRKDTQDLMETQKQLIETLAGLGPQVQQGAELIETFKKTFGGNMLGGASQG
jgi:hypothetical protein